MTKRQLSLHAEAFAKCSRAASSDATDLAHRSDSGANSGTSAAIENGTDAVVGRTRRRVSFALCGSRSRLCSNEACLDCRVRSFAGYSGQTAEGRLKRDCWVVELNKKTPRQVFQQSAAECWFRCDVANCGHIFQSILYCVVGQGCWCPFCSNPPKRLCDDEGCAACFSKSLASWGQRTAHGFKRDCWVVELNEKTPRQVFLQSSTKCSFRCDVAACCHVFKSCMHFVVKCCSMSKIFLRAKLQLWKTGKV